MDLTDLGEFGLIGRLRALVPTSGDERLVLGIGDDAAVWRSTTGFTLATTDTMVAGVHFLPGRVAWRDVGWKALAVNISDIAAMGGTPTFALVTLALPEDMDLDELDDLYAGLGECAAACSVTIAGGDTVTAPVFSITIALMGDATTGPDGAPVLLRRDAARVGDSIAVTGPLGGSSAGLRLLQSGVESIDGPLVARHMRPPPRIDAGRAAIAAGVRCAIDVSDGLVQDLRHVCAASGVNARISLGRVPVDGDARAIFPAEAMALALSGGEDYELILIGIEAQLERASTALNTALTIIGQIVEGRGAVHLFDDNGREHKIKSGGWDHLAVRERS